MIIFGCDEIYNCLCLPVRPSVCRFARRTLHLTQILPCFCYRIFTKLKPDKYLKTLAACTFCKFNGQSQGKIMWRIRLMFGANTTHEGSSYCAHFPDPTNKVQGHMRWSKFCRVHYVALNASVWRPRDVIYITFLELLFFWLSHLFWIGINLIYFQNVTISFACQSDVFFGKCFIK